MISKIKIWHFLVALFAAILLLRFNNVIELISILFLYVRLIIGSPSTAFKLFDITILDYFLAVLVLLSIPVFTLILRNRIRVLKSKLEFVFGIIIVLVVTALLAPIISTSNPKFQYDIANAKLLPPLSTKKIITLSPKFSEDNSLTERFIEAFRSYHSETKNEEAFIVDDIQIDDTVTLIQGNKTKEIKKEYLSENNLEIKTTSRFFILGTDEFSRDIFSRIIYGARLSLFIGIASVIISLIVGLTLGFLSGFTGGVTDTIFNRTTEMFLAFPMIFLIILIVALFGNSLIVVVLVLGLSGWMSLFKIVRSEVISLREKDFIVTSKMLGYSKSKILIKEMFPLLMAPIVTNLVLQFSNVIIAESALSYLGLGLGNNYASWGSMIEAGQYYLTSAWWMSFSPCGFLILTVISINILGNKMESLLDPRLR